MPSLFIASSGLLDGDPSGATLVWVLVCAALVLLMQAGFCLLESGLSRSKHSINVAIKNLADLCVSSVIFWSIGFGVMFGVSSGGWFGTTHFAVSDDPALMIFALFQVAFCGTATTIVSGAVAERMKFGAYLALCSVVALLIYPVFGHWAWGGAIAGTGSGWLAQIGFIDFAGSTVVHAVGGWIALAAILIVGPRRGRFDEKTGRPQGMTGQDYPAATAGIVILWIGWVGFNGGSLLDVDGRLARIVLNTVLAGAAGGAAAIVFSYVRKQRVHPGDIFGGVVAGLVSVTAGCHAYGPLAAVPIALIAGVVYVLGAMALERRRIDDVIGAVPAHALAGAWGTIAVALFADADMLSDGLTRYQQVLVQVTGTLAAFVWGFGGGGLVLLVTNRLMPLRVSKDAEEYGLNVIEHGTSTATVDLLEEMDRNRLGDFDRRVSVEPNTEVGQIAELYNGVLDRFQLETESRQAAVEALRQAETEYRLMFENAVEGVYRRSSEGDITAANQAYASLLGFESPEDVLEAGADEISKRYEDSKFPYEIGECATDREYRSTIIVDGVNREILERVRELRDEDTGDLLWIQAAVTDITETIRAEQLQSEVDIANAANAAKSEFLASMSHELRTPLHGVSGMLELMSGTTLDDEQRKLLGNAKLSSDALMSQINDVLDLSKIESGMLELKPEKFEVITLVENVVAAFSTTVPTDDVELICDISPRVPTAVNGDAGRLRQILANLVGNAVKFTVSGEIRVAVDLSVSDQLQFVVSDTGPGMDDDVLARIFEPYTQGKSQSSHCKGTGLGLAICSELAQLMGGEISVESEVGKGAAFTVLLPLPAELESNDATVFAPGQKPLRILVVDDRESNLQVLEKQLSCWDHDIVTSSDPTAVEAVLHDAMKSGRPFDLLVVDHRMPVRDGIEVSSAVHSDDALRSLPIIVATSHPLGVPEAEREIAGLAAVIEKPVRQSELFNGILAATSTESMFTGTAAKAKQQVTACGIRVLVAEDNGINQTFCRHVLKSAGYDLTIVNDGQPAVDAFVEACDERRPFDVVLMDCQMIETDGFTATGLIRNWEQQNDRNETPIIALTANAIVGDREKCLAAGMTDYLTKPIDAESLLAAVQQAATFGNDASSTEASGDQTEAESEQDACVIRETSPADSNLREPVSQSHLNVAELRERCLDDSGFMQAVLEQFSNELPGLIGSIFEAVEANDWDAAADAAHTLKGVAGNVAAETLRARAESIETSIRKHLDDATLRPDTESISQLVDDAEVVLTAIGKLPLTQPASDEVTL